MELIHTLTYNGTTTTIEEPIGFDDLKTTIKRGDYHGISVELSVGSLEFYGTAFSIIKEAYHNDVDSKIEYAVSRDGNVFYSGIVDLSTYSEKCGDYCSIICKIGDIGAKTTFNNRSDKDVDLNTGKTIDGTNLTMQGVWNEIKIPLKHLKFTNLWKYSNDVTYKKNSEGKTLQFKSGYNQQDITLPLKNVSSEFGETADTSVEVNPQQASPIYSLSDDNKDAFIADFGENTTYDLSGEIKVRVNFIDDPCYTHNANKIECTLKLICKTSSASVVLATHSTMFTKSGDDWEYGEATLNIPSGISRSYTDSLYVQMDLRIVTPEGQTTYIFDYSRFSITMQAGTNVKMTMYDKLADTGVIANMISVHNALNVIAGVISENALSVKSDWYGGYLSQWNKPSVNGGGSLKAITNGYKIRGLFTEGETERNMPVSFKTMINSLNAIDCIGWGFSKEDGADCVRVDRWDWFYKDSVILSLEGANEITTSINTDAIKPELAIGYKKYETTSAFNSIDSVHGERSFMNAIKLIGGTRSQMCDLIADTYSIEETRRSRDSVDSSESFKYDENIFIFELSAYVPTGSSTAVGYNVPNNIVSCSGVDRPSEQYNVQLSPRRCAQRWISYLFSYTNGTPYRFISGKINYKASFQCHNADVATQGGAYKYLWDCANGSTLKEDDPIICQYAKFKAEKIKFTYPLTLDQYKAVMDNPYGLISIDGIEGWISEMQYTFATGETEFTLIPKK